LGMEYIRKRLQQWLAEIDIGKRLQWYFKGKPKAGFAQGRAAKEEGADSAPFGQTPASALGQR